MRNNTILILNGPGLADSTLESIRAECSAHCEQPGLNLDFRQTDDEDEMFRWITKDSENIDALIINPVGYSHATSIEFEMYRSALKATAHFKKPVIEVHMNNIFHADTGVAKPLQVPEAEIGFICGMGIQSYLLAIKAVERRLTR